VKRFYKFVSLGETPKGFSILLDGKPVKTPSRTLLQTPHRDLANAIVQEWVAQGDRVQPSTMPLMQLLNTRIDRVGTEREEMTALLLKYLDTDLLCYRADHPPEMAKRQPEAWDPWLEWFKGEFGTSLETTTGLQALKQPEAARKSAAAFIEGLDDDVFTVLQLIVPLSGSLVIGLAFIKRAITPQQVFDITRVEEAYKAELYNEKQYGPDPSQEKKDKSTMVDLDAAAKFLDLLS